MRTMSKNPECTQMLSKPYLVMLAGSSGVTSAVRMAAGKCSRAAHVMACGGTQHAAQHNRHVHHVLT